MYKRQTRLDGVSAPDAYLGLVGMAASAFIQWRTLKEKEDQEDFGEKEYVF